ncbi:uncharacterized protein LOC131248928 [Magnolia sinica]|uniref:uncharacterized protein LOC131248928 n=1 Tax=Magnolia sinica TaxID=86752 RepID=UPI0026582D10|nr:uncharacterized protein LOC131248928 [Magnolia sinica]
MPFPMKIQPIDSAVLEQSMRADPAKPAAKSRFKRLFERQFPSVLRISTAERFAAEQHCSKDAGDLEPSSVALAKMVQNFLEESSEKQVEVRCGRSRRNCFNGNCSDGSEDEFEFSSGSSSEALIAALSGEACEILKSLVPCTSVSERNLLADAAKIIEKNKICKRKDDCRRIVTNGLLALGYDASICKSRWEKSPSFPAGEYEYVDAIVEGERLLIDVDFRSEFEIARSTGNYKAVLQSLPSIFVGKPDRLQQIVAVVSEAAKQSLKKKGLHFPPWRKPEYMRAKWLSPYQRQKPIEESTPCQITTRNFSGEFELIFEEKNASVGKDSSDGVSYPASEEGEKITVVVSPWKPPAVKPKVVQEGAKMVTGLASVLREKP